MPRGPCRISHTPTAVFSFSRPSSESLADRAILSRVLPVFIVVLLLVCGVFPVCLVSGQVPPVLDPTGRSGEPPPVTQEQPLRPTPPTRKILPPLEHLPGAPGERLPVIRVFVKHIRLIGNSVFSAEVLQPILQKYENREVSTEDLQELRRELTLFYVNHGYINSGAVIPDQTVQNGVITIQIIEGELSEIDVEGTEYFLASYFENRIALNAGPPLNIRPLRERLQLLLQDPRIRRLNSELKPGLRPGESILHVRVEEAPPFRAWTEFNNFQSPTVGAERGLGTIVHDNIFGIGDTFQFTFGGSNGVFPLVNTSYVAPVTPRDTTVAFQYRRNDFSVISSQFDFLDIESETEIFSVTVRHPVYRTLQDEVALAVTMERLRNQTFQLGKEASFTSGTTPSGKSVVSALRLIQEWIHRESDQVLALRSRFSIGLDALGATNNRINANDPDSQFFVWLGQGQWARRFDPLGIQFLSTVVLQVSNERLFPLEQFAVGGRFSVRGYRENQFVRDNAFLFSVESRVPVFPSILGSDHVLYLAPFIDVGRSWNAKVPTTGIRTLASIGMGFRYAFQNRAQVNVYWGQQLNHIPDPPPGGNLQDHGVHVQVILNIL